MDMASNTSMVGVEKERMAGRKRPCAFGIGYIQPFAIGLMVSLSVWAKQGLTLSQASIRFGGTFFF